MAFDTGLISYLDSIRARDAAPRSRLELLLYPGVLALALHRIGHRLFGARFYFAARLVNHLSRLFTGIDIHPGAVIGRNFFLEHGFTVIGETAEIGDDVTIYQQVTLGGTNPANGRPGKRHPTIGDGAIIGSGAQILGPITVGAGARIGANAVVTRDVPDGATMVGIPARQAPVDTAATARDFIPYGTTPGGMTDLQSPRIDRLERQVELLQARLAELSAFSQAVRDARRDRA